MKKTQVWRTNSAWQQEGAERNSELFYSEIKVEKPNVKGMRVRPTLQPGH